MTTTTISFVNEIVYYYTLSYIGLDDLDNNGQFERVTQEAVVYRQSRVESLVAGTLHRGF